VPAGAAESGENEGGQGVDDAAHGGPQNRPENKEGRLQTPPAFLV
jgi:hypothetical protein